MNGAAAFLSIFSATVLAANGQAPRVSVGLPADLNALVLRAIAKMPEGGKYAATGAANKALRDSMSVGLAGLALEPERAQPSYCSGATYLVLLQVIRDLEKGGAVQLDDAVNEALLVRGQPDGAGVWGRWNANGPGTARLFAELGLGKNFTDWNRARRGDFMKVWWNDEIGKLERGHSVIYLGRGTVDGEEAVTFWSSNQPGGYGEKTIPRKKIVWALFSRLENPRAIAGAAALPVKDAYLASMLKERTTRAEVAIQCKAD